MKQIRDEEECDNVANGDLQRELYRLFWKLEETLRKIF